MPIIFKYDEGSELLSAEGYEAKNEDALGWVMQEFCEDYSFNFEKCKFFWWPEDEDVVELDEMLFPYQTKTAGGTVMETDQIHTVYASGPKIPALEPKRGPQPGPALEIFEYIGTKEMYMHENQAKIDRDMRHKEFKASHAIRAGPGKATTDTTGTPLFAGMGKKLKPAETHAVNTSEILFAREEKKREAMREAAAWRQQAMRAAATEGNPMPFSAGMGSYKESSCYIREQAAKEVATWKWEDFHGVEATKAKVRSQDDPTEKPTPTKKAKV
jgi:hypothetical protein